MRTILALSATALVAFADVSYDSTSRITGGMLSQMASMPVPGMGEARKALEPQVSRVSVKGDRMIDKSADNATITDLDKETITTINYKDRTFTVMTFAEMKEKMLRAQQQLNQKGTVDAKFDLDVKETGRTQSFDGVDCREVIFTTKISGSDPKTGQTAEFATNSVMWMAKSVTGGDELRSFQERMAQKLQMDPTFYSQVVVGGFGQSIAKLQEKARAMEGFPIVQVVTIGSTADGLPQSIDIPDTSEALRRADEEAAAQRKAENDARNAQMKTEAGNIAVDSATQSAATAAAGSAGRYGGVAAGAIGRLGGFGRRKSTPPPAPPPASSPAPSSAGGSTTVNTGVLMQMRITDSGFSTAAVDSSVFDIPAGFTESRDRK